MFDFLKRKNKYPDLNKTVEAIAQFLIDDSGSDLPTPLKEFIDSAKLDYSLESLKHVDSYLDQVRNQKKNLNRDQLTKVIARAGAYCGEVVRKNSKKNFYWINYDTAVNIPPKGKFLVEKSVYTFYILFIEPEGFSFPLAKVGKYLDNGPEDSLWGFASMVLSTDKTQ